MALLSSPLHILASIPPATRAFTATLVGFSALNLYLTFDSTRSSINNDITNGLFSYAQWLTVWPGLVVWAPWTLVTAGFVEEHFLELLAALVFLPASLRYLERLWGAIETIKFIVIVLTVSNIIAVAFNWIVYFVLGSQLFLYGMDYHGTMALQAAILVAFTQVIPEHQVQFFKSISIRVKNLPMAYVTVSTIATFLGYQSPWFLIQLGWLVSWAYLRFYKRSTDSLSGIVTYGDRSETFAFILWFPPFLHKPLSIASTFTHNLAIKLKLIRPFSLTAADLEAGAYAPLPMNNTQPGGSRAEAERRRAMALKALDQRLASAGTKGSPSSRAGKPGSSNGTATAPTATGATGGASSSSGTTAPLAASASNGTNVGSSLATSASGTSDSTAKPAGEVDGK